MFRIRQNEFAQLELHFLNRKSPQKMGGQFRGGGLDQFGGICPKKITGRDGNGGVIDRGCNVVLQIVKPCAGPDRERQRQPLRISALIFGDTDPRENFEFFDVNLIGYGRRLVHALALTRHRDFARHSA